MNKNKLLIFFILIFNIYVYANDKIQMEYILNAKTEALGSTGMIFGEEYGAFFRAPTAIIKIHSKSSRTRAELQGQNVHFNLNSLSSFISLRINNFSVACIYSSSHYDLPIYIPIVAAFQIKNLSLGFGAKYILNIEVGSLLSGDASVMYSSNIGDFSLCMRDVSLYEFFGAPISPGTKSLKNELRLGYGKRFQIKNFFNEVELAIELNNLLMNSIYIGSIERDYNLFRKLNLGLDFKKSENTNHFHLRAGMKNLFPTFGISFNLKDIFEISYAFTNRDLGNKWGNERKIINLLALTLKLSDDNFKHSN